MPRASQKSPRRQEASKVLLPAPPSLLHMIMSRRAIGSRGQTSWVNPSCQPFAGQVGSGGSGARGAGGWASAQSIFFQCRRTWDRSCDPTHRAKCISCMYSSAGANASSQVFAARSRSWRACFRLASKVPAAGSGGASAAEACTVRRVAWHTSCVHCTNWSAARFVAFPVPLRARKQKSKPSAPRQSTSSPACLRVMFRPRYPAATSRRSNPAIAAVSAEAGHCLRTLCKVGGKATLQAGDAPPKERQDRRQIATRLQGQSNSQSTS